MNSPPSRIHPVLILFSWRNSIPLMAKARPNKLLAIQCWNRKCQESGWVMWDIGYFLWGSMRGMDSISSPSHTDTRHPHHHTEPELQDPSDQTRSSSDLQQSQMWTRLWGVLSGLTQIWVAYIIILLTLPSFFLPTPWVKIKWYCSFGKAAGKRLYTNGLKETK